jgi:hypothetical protein
MCSMAIRVVVMLAFLSFEFAYRIHGKKGDTTQTDRLKEDERSGVEGEGSGSDAPRNGERDNEDKDGCHHEEEDEPRLFGKEPCPSQCGVENKPGDRDGPHHLGNSESCSLGCGVD